MSQDFFSKYSFKIKTAVKNIKPLFKEISKKKKVILCHGVFDVVHPGYNTSSLCQKLADILVISITADKYITMGTYRPHVPQN